MTTDLQQRARDLCAMEPADGNGVPYCTTKCHCYAADMGGGGPWCCETATHTPNPDTAHATVPCYAWALAAAGLLREVSR